MVVTSEYKGDPLLQILDKNFLGNPSIIFFFSFFFLGVQSHNTIYQFMQAHNSHHSYCNLIGWPENSLEDIVKHIP